mmetsp:Transcript_31035/g.88557  ORF Transcript_31035/g.88557 Transcript_31035/m.88557 type:complete len:265 (+) Transcript_31035:276-1070(+)
MVMLALPTTWVLSRGLYNSTLMGSSSRPMCMSSTLVLGLAASQAISGRRPVATTSPFTARLMAVSINRSCAAVSWPAPGFLQPSKYCGPNSNKSRPVSTRPEPWFERTAGIVYVCPLRWKSTSAEDIDVGEEVIVCARPESATTSFLKSRLTARIFDSKMFMALSAQTMVRWMMTSWPSTFTRTSDGEGSQIPLTVLEHMTSPVAMGFCFPSSMSATRIGCPRRLSWEMLPKFHFSMLLRKSVMPELYWLEVHFETPLKLTPTA